MQIYITIYVYSIYVCIDNQVYVCICIYSMCVSMCGHLYVYLCAHICMCTSMYMGVYVCIMYVHISVFMDAYVLLIVFFQGRALWL